MFFRIKIVSAPWFVLTVPTRLSLMIMTMKQYVLLKMLTKVCKFRWKIEQYHREVKQATGIGKCQAGNHRAQVKHIVTSVLAWIVL